MVTEGNKAVVRRLVDEVWNGGSRAAAEEVLRPERVDGLMRHLAGARRSRPDVRWTVEDMLADGEKVVVRWTSSGTHTGPWNHPASGPIEPSGKMVTNRGITIFRLEDRKIAEVWEFSDVLGLVQQLGASSPARAEAE